MDLLEQAAMANALTVSVLTERIRKQLEGGFREVWVRGEVTNLRRQSSGHIYFSLKDAESQLSCVLFRGDANRQTDLPENGKEFILCGGISLYAPRGSYQLIVRLVIASGAGRLQAEFERLKRMLAGEGIFDRSRKRLLPVLPLRIAVLTSSSGAALQDFLRILQRRACFGHVTLFPARVQGVGAAADLIAGLAEAQRGAYDIIVLTRGGGSMEDLWAFNDPDLARAVAASGVVTVSAVGHEIDHVLTDYAADIRAETPSGAAELISSQMASVLERLHLARERLLRARMAGLNEVKSKLKLWESEFKSIDPKYRLEKSAMRLDDLEQGLLRALADVVRSGRERLERCVLPLERLTPRSRVQFLRERLLDRGNRLQRGRLRLFEEHAKALLQVEERLRNNGIEATLRRGYTLLTDEQGKLLASREAVLATSGKKVTARLRDGDVGLKLDA